MKHSILIIEPSEIIYKGIATIINDNTNFSVIKQLNSVQHLDTTISIFKPDVIIINPTLINDSKCDFLNLFTNIQQDTPIIALVYQYIEINTLKQYDGIIDIRDSSSKISVFFSSFCIPKYSPYAMIHKMIIEEITISSLNTCVP